MNYKEWSAKRFWIVLALVFTLGFWLSPSGKTEVIEKTVEVKTETDLTDWKALKDVDDRVIGNCATMLNYNSNAFFAASELDVERMEELNEKIEALLPLFIQSKEDRLEVLERLGY